MKVLIIDDHAILREGIAVLLLQAADVTAVLEARNGTEGLAITQQNSDIDVVLLDLEMPGLDGRSALDEFSKQHPELPVIILSSSEDPQDVRLALAAGALGYVPKSASAKTLLAALHLVLQGDIYVPPLLLELGSGQSEGNRQKTGLECLTERQTEVLELIERGLSNKEISDTLGLSEKTVKVHVTGILRALHVPNRAQAAAAARSAARKKCVTG